MSAATDADQADRLVGQSIPGRTNRRLARGRAQYVADVTPTGLLHVAIVRSPHAHALIRGWDIAAAQEMPGVTCVVTGEEIQARTAPLPEGWDSARAGAKRVDWYALCATRVRYVGEAVAAVVAADRATAFRAAALVQVCSIALLVYGLVETEVRATIAPARTIPALLPEGRAGRPTAANIFAAFTGLGYQRARTSNGLECIADPITPAQSLILAALGIGSILPPQP